MPEALQIQIEEEGMRVFEIDLPDVLEVGRQRIGEADPYSFALTTEGPPRLVVANHQETNCSRKHLVLEILPDGKVRVSNRSQMPLLIQDQPIMGPLSAIDLSAPFQFSIASRLLKIVAKSIPGSSIQKLNHETVLLTMGPEFASRLRKPPRLNTEQTNELIEWLSTTMGVLQSSIGSADFLAKATEALVKIVGLHSGHVLLREGEEWKRIAGFGRFNANFWQPSKHVLEQVVREKKTFWLQSQPDDMADSPSLARLQTVVASPILDATGKVIGSLYGERNRDEVTSQFNGKIGAVLVELLACGVATGLARQNQEKAVLQAQVRFEQFFGPDLARRLASDPEMLQGRDAEVSLLFTDVRNFSRISEKLNAPSLIVEWINDVMNTLSECVLAEEGVLVDYIGDEMIAMWGAPEPQVDQAHRSVRAGIAMLEALERLNTRWEPRIGEATEVGIGINTGVAQVGNTGSKFKFKYGPLGNSVNVASRVQGMTKYLKCRFLVTRTTRDQLGADFLCRRVCKTRVVNIKGAIDLYQIEPLRDAAQRNFFAESQAALDALEERDFALAARKAGELLPANRGDGPLLLILSRASAGLMTDGVGFDPIWEPPGK